jgi:AcrR family transcriptional regulator
MTNSPVDSGVADRPAGAARRPGKRELANREQGREPRARKPGKRERLVAGASQVFYQQGVEHTTIADVARAADVPVGNVYYYFKTKDDIIAAVIESRVHEVEATIAAVDRQYDTPAARLKALVHVLTDQGQLIAQYGCPMGTLCSELDKRSGGADPAAARLMRIPIGWAEQQFRSMGQPDAHALAVQLIAAYEGIALLTNALGEPELMIREAERLERWIDSLASETLSSAAASPAVSPPAN